MALTFGTLLSSQGADAHRPNRLRLFRGNPRNATPVRALGSNPLPPGFPLGRRSPGIDLGGASRLGDVRSGSLSGSALRTRRTLASRTSESQIPSADAQHARKHWGRGASADQMIKLRRGADLCDLGHRAPQPGPVGDEPGDPALAVGHHPAEHLGAGQVVAARGDHGAVDPHRAGVDVAPGGARARREARRDQRGRQVDGVAVDQLLFRARPGPLRRGGTPRRSAPRPPPRPRRRGTA